MPHVVVKLYSGRSEQQKTRLAEEVTKAVNTALSCGEDAISIAVEDVQPEDWTKKVYETDIMTSRDKLYKKPGYGALAK